MAIVLTVLGSLALVVATVLIHYEVLRGASLLLPRLSIPVRTRILVAIAACFVAHLLEIGLYAVVYYVMQVRFGIGVLAGETEGNFLDFFYFSITTYTTLGVGDLFPKGPIRLISGIESLNGLVLIAWSASFTYLAMEKFWDEHRRRR
ncbi:MAG TPA: potassium channel family protein [Beijerinckiaceae bacterium]|nr:potassium channel family protein [Beijerinckiaceae bacterium]